MLALTGMVTVEISEYILDVFLDQKPIELASVLNRRNQERFLDIGLEQLDN